MRLRWRMIPLALAAALLISGMSVFFARLARNGADWALNPWNDSIYQDGILSAGTVTDRNGFLLTAADRGTRVWSGDELTRISTLHAVGDPLGYIGTGALSAFERELSGYTVLGGLYSQGGRGGTVSLSLDASLCRTAWDALDGRSGAVLVCNYVTGEILCMTSSPSYDPADPGAQIPDGAYLNRAVSGLYPPGSVFKLVTAAAALRYLPDAAEGSYLCEGEYEVSGSSVACTGVHGLVTLDEAFASSCNCAFAQISLEVGGEALRRTASSLGLCSPVFIDGIESASGSVQAAADGSVDLAWTGIGQYTDLVCPVAMLRLCSAVAAHGSAPALTILAGNAPGPAEQILSPDTAAVLDGMMELAVSATYGPDNFPGLVLRAKSGTAEVDGAEPHAWFCGYLADPARPLAFVVVVENGGSGARTAGGVANEVLQAAAASWDRMEG